MTRRARTIEAVFKPTRGSRLTLTMVALFWAAGCTSMPKQRPTVLSVKPSATVRIATYNIFVGNRDFEATAKIVNGLNADVVALQEVDHDAAKALNALLANSFVHRHFNSEGGLAIVSRLPLINPRYQPSRNGLNGFLFAEVELEGRRIQLANLHLDPIRTWTTSDQLKLPLQVLQKSKVHRDEITQVLDSLQEAQPTVMVGDLNSESPSLVNHLRDAGFTDSFTSATPDTVDSTTFHFTKLGMRFGSRIDYIFHSKEFRTVDSALARGDPSDHHAVVSTLALH